MQPPGNDESGPSVDVVDPPRMVPSPKSERRRGLKEAAGHLERLREMWPGAFPADARRVRPLASTAARTIAETMGWNTSFTKGVMNVWKNRTAYCQALLRYEERLHLDGTVSDERVDAKARQQAQETLELKAARKARLAERAHAGQPSGAGMQPARLSSSKTVAASV